MPPAGSRVAGAVMVATEYLPDHKMTKKRLIMGRFFISLIASSPTPAAISW
jgi:hypothetical protein